MFSQPRIQTDVRAVLEMDNLGANSAEVNRILGVGNGDGNDDRPGTTLEWMALRRAGKPAISRRVQWAGDKPLEGYQFVIDNLTETLTFFVPKICGNISLMSREPSREAARRAEEARKAEAAKAAAAAAAADAAKKAEAAKAAPQRTLPTRRRRRLLTRPLLTPQRPRPRARRLLTRRLLTPQRPRPLDSPPRKRRFASDRSSPGTSANSSVSTTTTTPPASA